MAKYDVRSGKIDIKGIVGSGELEGTAEIGGGVGENQIVVYQDKRTRLWGNCSKNSNSSIGVWT